jgi:hypothetical protein
MGEEAWGQSPWNSEHECWGVARVVRPHRWEPRFGASLGQKPLGFPKGVQVPEVAYPLGWPRHWGAVQLVV